MKKTQMHLTYAATLVAKTGKSGVEDIENLFWLGLAVIANPHSHKHIFRGHC